MPVMRKTRRVRVKTRMDPRNTSSNGLTSIHPRIHCVATDEGEDEYNEADRVIVQHFLQTLAEIALAVAARGGKQRQQ